MDVDRRLERLCERVTLVEGAGSPRRGELCVMSFVALLAGGRHTDHPAGASPLIRNLATAVNDALPRDERQRLKPLAARIVGTDDGRDQARVEVLRRTLEREILPRVRRDWGAGRDAVRRRVPLEFLFADAIGRDFGGCIAQLLARLERGVPPGSEPRVGAAVGELLARCMREATTRERRNWYRDAAVGLLDRLCDVGAEARGPAIRHEALARAEERLGDGGTWLGGIRRLVLAVRKAVEPRPGTARMGPVPAAAGLSAVRLRPSADVADDGEALRRGTVVPGALHDRAGDRRDGIHDRPLGTAWACEGA